MRRLILLTLISQVVISCNQPTGGTIISGIVKNPVDGNSIYLQKIAEGGLEIIDSVEVDTQGKFEFSVAVGEPDFYRLSVYNRQFVNLVLTENDKKVDVTVDGRDPRGAVDVKGSSSSDKLFSFDSLARKRQSDIQLLNQEATAARSRGDLKTLQDISNQYYYLSQKHTDNLKTMITTASPTLIGLYGVNYLDMEADFNFIDSVSQVFNKELADHPFASDLTAKVGALKKLAIGADAPEISLPSPDGELVSLSSLRGNYVLIDFWAAWCKPCRMENPNVVKLYEKYRNENFEIFGVSLDRQKQAWLKAIEDDGLGWMHVSDLQYFNSAAAREYNISAIPATYLIDPDGKILAKGLRGPTLRAKLQELFGT